MKRFKKLAAVLLACVMALTLLTACSGGGGSGAGNASQQLTNKVNEKLKDIGVVVQYDSKLDDKAVTCLDYYLNTDDMDAALKMAGLNEEEYVMIPTTAVSTLDTQASVFATYIRTFYENGYTAKKIGYATYTVNDVPAASFALVKF